MCLYAMTDRLHWFERDGDDYIGYKAMKSSPYRCMYYNTFKVLVPGIWHQAEGAWRIQAQYKVPLFGRFYNSGFHIFASPQDACYWFSDSDCVVRVKFRKVLAVGYQGDRCRGLTAVAEEMMIL